MVVLTEQEYLEHIGIKRRSGRYPWGSGNDPFQRSKDFRAYLDELKNSNPKWTESQIAEYIQSIAQQHDPNAKFTTTELRAAISVSTTEIRKQNASMAKTLHDKGMSNRAIAERMGLGEKGESTVRGWLKASDEIKQNSLEATANALKEQLKTKDFLDVGTGVHLYMKVSETKLRTALVMLKDEGYEVFTNLKVPQLGVADKLTTLRVLTKGGVTWNEARLAVKNGLLKTFTAQSDDNGQTFRTPASTPKSIDSKRVQVRYAEDGGAKMDGVVEIRRGLADMDLGASRYAQVRVAVDGTHFIKGMAMYADDLPAGVDMRFNTNKSSSTPGGKLGVMKPMKTDKEGNIDSDSPFGSTTHSQVYIDKNGKEQNSILNIVGTEGSGNIEGRWDQWSNSLSSQMLSKQPLSLATTQLGKALGNKQKEFNEIMALTNPVVKKQLLDEFAEGADASAVNLKAGSMNRQSTHVILPMNSMRSNQIYAPNFRQGERVALVRHPHGGPFEIPELIVNNNNAAAKRILGNATDAVGIHHSVAQKLSGADFDGDTVLVIPNDEGHVKSRPSLEGLKNFDPKEKYTIPEGDTTTVKMTKHNTQTEMGKISNLITDMSLQNANDDEMARAVRHSMVVIDAEKHGLDYKQSALDHNIAELKTTYQGGPRRGAATLISRAGAKERVPQQRLRKQSETSENVPGRGPVDPATGRKVFIKTGETYINSKGQVIQKTTKGKRMEFVTDARELLSGEGSLEERGTPMERTYATHANAMKDLANLARKQSVSLTMPKINPAAKTLYADEVQSLNDKLAIAQRNAPLERRAQVIGGAMARARIESNPGLTDDDIKKIKFQSLEEARQITGAAKDRIYIEDREWEAIQAGAVAHTRLSSMLRNSHIDRVKELATPRYSTYLTPGQVARMKQMASSGRSAQDIADELGIPRSTIVDNLARA